MLETPVSASSQVSSRAQSKGGFADRDPTRTESPRVRSRSTMRRPLLPVPPSTRTGLLDVDTVCMARSFCLVRLSE